MTFPQPRVLEATLGGTTYQRVKDRLRADILAGRIAPGTRLKITEIAGRYGLSHMPVREALQQLQGEGLVTLSPNRGASVRRMDAAFIRSLFDIREALESFLTRQAAALIDVATLDRLRDIQRRHDLAVDRGEITECAPLNRLFHETTFALTGNEEAIRLLEQHTSLIAALRSRVGYAPGRLETIQREHWALIDALARGDGEAAYRIQTLHVRSAGEDMLMMMREPPLQDAPG